MTTSREGQPAAVPSGADLHAIHVALRSVPIKEQDEVWFRAQEALGRLRELATHPAAPAQAGGDVPEIGSTWRHKNGNEYEVLMVANMSSERDEYPITVVYRGQNDKVWCRTLSRWHGSMTALRTPEQPAPAQRDEGVEGARTAFEAYIRKDAGDLSTFGQGATMHYRNSAVNNAWLGWQACMKWTEALATQQPAGDAFPPSRCKECRGTTFETTYNGGRICVECKLVYESPQPKAAPAAVEVYQLSDGGRYWQDCDKATFDWWQGKDRHTRIVYSAVASQPAPVDDVIWRIDNEASQFIDDKGMIYLRYLRDLLALASQPVAVDDTERAVIETLLELAYAAWCLADNTEDSGGDGLNVERSDFAMLEKHLNALDALPDDQPGYTMGEAAKARWALHRLIDSASGEWEA